MQDARYVNEDINDHCKMQDKMLRYVKEDTNDHYEMTCKMTYDVKNRIGSLDNQQKMQSFSAFTINIFPS